MKNAVFVDTFAWLALVNRSDELHEAARIARDQLEQQKTKLITTDYIIVVGCAPGSWCAR